jgi:hypothetical protein
VEDDAEELNADVQGVKVAEEKVADAEELNADVKYKYKY